MAGSAVAVIAITLLVALGLFLLFEPFLVAIDTDLDLDEEMAAGMLFIGAFLLAIALGVALW